MELTQITQSTVLPMAKDYPYAIPFIRAGMNGYFLTYDLPNGDTLTLELYEYAHGQILLSDVLSALQMYCNAAYQLYDEDIRMGYNDWKALYGATEGAMARPVYLWHIRCDNALKDALGVDYWRIVHEGEAD